MESHITKVPPAQPLDRSQNIAANAADELDSLTEEKSSLEAAMPACVPKFLAKLDFLSDQMTLREDGVPTSPEGLARGPILFGVWAFIIIFVVFGLWAAIAPIESAAIASGQITLDSNKKTIQHLEGGIVKKILVKEGAFVKKGDPLVQLDETAAQAKLDLLRTQYVAAQAAEARLLAERDEKEKVAFPQHLVDAEETHQVVADNLDSQRRLFDSRNKNIKGQVAILGQKKKQMDQEISGLRAQVGSAGSQVRLLNEEISVVRKLLASGNAMKPRLLALERQRAALLGSRGEYTSGISRAEQGIAEAEISIMNLKNQFLNDVVAELKETQVEVADLRERIRASSDTVNRIVIAAPIDGKVTDLKVHTEGGVIAPGDTVMFIVPQNDKLIVEARVEPSDIDVVRAGLSARVRLSAFKARTVPLVMGTVVDVSGDRFDDERTGIAYYVARIEIDHEELEVLRKLGDDMKLYPGMPTETLIVTGSRTFLSYMMTPISESFNRAFREQ